MGMSNHQRLPAPKHKVQRSRALFGAVAAALLSTCQLSVTERPNSSQIGTPSFAGSESVRPSVPGSDGPDAGVDRPPFDFPPLTDSGSLATVLIEDLRVHEYADSAFDAPVSLSVGTQVLVSMGPVANGGLDWYEVYFSALDTDGPMYETFRVGWVAAGPTGQPPSTLRIHPPRCPQAMTVAGLGAMTGHARLGCLGTGSYELVGFLSTCTDYSTGGAEPAWLFITCVHLRDAGAAPWTPPATWEPLFVYWPPDLDTQMHASLDGFVRLVGHFDDPIAAECRTDEPPVTTDGVDPTVTERDQAYVILRCRSQFVVSDVGAVAR